LPAQRGSQKAALARQDYLALRIQHLSSLHPGRYQRFAGLKPLWLRISRKEGQRFTACRSMVSRHVGPLLMKQDVLNFLSETNIRQ